MKIDLADSASRDRARQQNVEQHLSIRQLPSDSLGKEPRLNGSPGLVALFIFAAACVPVFRLLPGSVSQLWFASVFGTSVFLIITGRARQPRFAVVWLLLAFGVGVAILTSGSGIGDGNSRVGIQMLGIFTLLPFALAGIAAEDRGLFRVGTTTFVIVQSVSSLAGVAQVAGISVLGYTVTQGRSPGLAGHPNVLGIFSSVAIILCIAHLVKGRNNRAIAWGVLLLNFAGLLATGSLSSLSSCIVGVVVALCAARIKVSSLFKAGAGFAIFGFLIGQLTGIFSAIRSPADRYLQVSGQTDAASTAAIRNETYRYALNWISSEPFFGRGLNSEIAGATDSGTVVHNLLLRGWFQGGILLGLSLTIFVCTIFAVCAHAIVHKIDEAPAGILATVIAFSMTSAFFEQAYYWIPVIAAWACLSSRSQIESKRERSTFPT